MDWDKKSKFDSGSQRKQRNKENKEINEHLKTFPHLILDMNISAGVIAS